MATTGAVAGIAKASLGRPPLAEGPPPLPRCALIAPASSRAFQEPSVLCAASARPAGRGGPPCRRRPSRWALTCASSSHSSGSTDDSVSSDLARRLGDRWKAALETVNGALRRSGEEPLTEDAANRGAKAADTPAAAWDASGTASFNAEVSQCERRGDWKKIRRLMASMRQIQIEPGIEAYSSAMRACVRSRRHSQAVQMLCEMWRDGPEPDHSAYLAALKACNYGYLWEWALRIVQEAASRGHALRREAYDMALGACHFQQWESSLWLLERMRQEGVDPAMSSYSRAVTACWKSGRSDEGKQLLEDMLGLQVEPDLLFYQSTVRACGMAGQWEQALSLLRESQAAGIESSPRLFTDGIVILAKSGRWQAAQALLAEAHSLGLRPEESAATSIRIEVRQGELRMKRLLDDEKAAG